MPERGAPGGLSGSPLPRGVRGDGSPQKEEPADQKEESAEPVLVAVAHGSADPRATAAVEDLMTIVARRATQRAGQAARAQRAQRAGQAARAQRAGQAVQRAGQAPRRAPGPGLSPPDLLTAYLGHAAPSLPQVMGAIKDGTEVSVLPLLLTSAYHSKTDIPRVLAHLRRDFPLLRICYGAALGPHPLLLQALERRLAEAAPEVLEDPAQTGVVLAAAGSSDPDANATIARLAARWQARAGWFAVRSAYAASATGPSPASAVTGLLRAGAPRVVVATYLLAPGVFADRIRDASHAAGAAAVSAALGATPEVADVLLDRYQEAGSGRRAAA